MSDNEIKTIGKVTATENKPTTTTTVYFWLHHDVIVRPFDIVRIEHISKNKNSASPSHSFALVKELSYITDSAGHLANYVSSDFGDVGALEMNKRLGTTIAEAEILGNSENIEMPIRDGARVEWAGADEIRKALGVLNLKEPIPARVYGNLAGRRDQHRFRGALSHRPGGWASQHLGNLRSCQQDLLRHVSAQCPATAHEG
uniref:Uncharacterized protein n=1 Tax=Candidatus Kentrum sp. LPFa TaxID=2126335 RepID=A0A450XBS4_9GAMM|nr:MAG: hypothetical protein BECKLPF1236A_GA0070988_1004112 [Candidatus Kentron sp. LPFa]VFK26735.1 MAG: hypothetical protein BECKLPF1236C_GA0070990_1003814 [Candidatus Kentron sp. LPFa]